LDMLERSGRRKGDRRSLAEPAGASELPERLGWAMAMVRSVAQPWPDVIIWPMSEKRLAWQLVGYGGCLCGVCRR
jgi:hypothetical protein